MKSLEENHTWELGNLPNRRKATGCKLTFKEEKSDINQYKAHLVAQEFSQKLTTDCNKTFAPVKHVTIRLFLSNATHKKSIYRCQRANA